MKSKMKKIIAYTCSIDLEYEFPEGYGIKIFKSKKPKELAEHGNCGITKVELKEISHSKPNYVGKNPLQTTLDLIEKTTKTIEDKKNYLRRLKKDLKRLSKKK